MIPSILKACQGMFQKQAPSIADPQYRQLGDP
jgi:hypothetical protein